MSVAFVTQAYGASRLISPLASCSSMATGYDTEDAKVEVEEPKEL